MRFTEDPGARAPSGANAVAGALLAVIGVLAAAHPESLLLRAVQQSAPELSSCVATLITTCGAIIAALSQPPKVTWRG